MDGTVVTVRDGSVNGVYTTDVQDADFSYADKFKTLNIYRFDRDFCRRTLQPLLEAYADHVDPSSYYELVLAMLSNIPAHRISAEVVSGERWVEVDDPNDLAGAAFRFEPGRRTEILDRAFGGHWNFDVLDFSLMRNAYFPTGSMLAAMRHALPDLVSDYGSAQPVLNEKLGYVLRCDPAHVQVLHGASQAFPILGRSSTPARLRRRCQRSANTRAFFLKPSTITIHLGSTGPSWGDGESEISVCHRQPEYNYGHLAREPRTSMRSRQAFLTHYSGSTSRLSRSVKSARSSSCCRAIRSRTSSSSLV